MYEHRYKYLIEPKDKWEGIKWAQLDTFNEISCMYHLDKNRCFQPFIILLQLRAKSIQFN